MDEVHILLWKIQRRFDEHSELHQSVEERVYLAGEFADQAARCRANTGGRRGTDEIGHRFRLSEVDFIVEECALGELTRLGKGRARASRQRCRASARTAAPPCPCSSRTFSPVYDAGAGKNNAMPLSSVSPCAPWNAALVATRGASGRPIMPLTIPVRSGPETRTMPMPPRPGGVAIAAMTSVSAALDMRSDYARGGSQRPMPRFTTSAISVASSTLSPLASLAQTSLPSSLPSLRGNQSRLAFEHTVHVPLLKNLQRVVDQPVEHQAGREKDEHHRKRDRHDLHHLGLHRILNRRRGELDLA